MRKDFGGGVVWRGRGCGGSETILGVACQAGCVFGIGVERIVAGGDGGEEFGGWGEGANGGGGRVKGRGGVGEVRVEGCSGFPVGVVGGGGGGGLGRGVWFRIGFGFEEGGGSGERS